MMNDDRYPYRWQDHIVPARRAIAGLMATALVVFVVGGAEIRAHGSPADTPRVAAVHAASERTPSLAEMAKRRVTPRYTKDWL